MNLTTQPTLTSAALTHSVTALRRSGPLTALVAVVLLVGLIRGGAPAAAGDGAAADPRVGHSVERIVVEGAVQGELRPLRHVDVHLWYPADRKDGAARPKSIYTSALHGQPLIPEGPWDPLSWSVEAKIAREGAAIDPDGKAFPVIVFSHGSVNDPINYAYLLELIAAEGFIVAAPSHVTDTQEDVRIDFINPQLPPTLRFPCNDGLPGPCSRPNNTPSQPNTVALRMADRARDISTVLDELPGWFGARADLSRVGVLGHSRGTLSGLAAAAGSTAWDVEPDPRMRVKAVMGMASGGTLTVTLQPNLSSVEVPTLLVAGGLDRNSSLSINEALFERIACPVEDPVGCAEPNAEKAFVLVPDAHHRSFISTFCDQTQATGAIAQANPRAIFETNAVTGLLTNLAGGRAMDYCALPTFTAPIDIRPLVRSITGFCITGELVDPIPGPCTTSGNVPTTGLDNDQVTQQMTKLAVKFFKHQGGQ